ncbi:MAG: sugar transferase [Chloroflexaceae bacterium]|jgi:NDP-sugar pyrophosphorylase family protein|nr:sugar transferase [Chloroflexaceae bacterium]
MHIFLLATNEHSALYPLTDTLPAPLLPIANRPVLERTIEVLVRAGYKDMLVSLYQQGGQIAAYFGSGSRWGAQIQYVTQQEAWGSAGSLKWASNLLKETVLVLPGHAVFDLDIEAALAFHHQHGGPATAIVQSSSYRGTTLMQADAQGRLAAIGQGLPNTTLAPTGAYIFEPDVLQYIAPDRAASCEDDLLPALLRAGVAVFCHQMTGYWNPLDSVRAYYDAQQVYLYSAYRQAHGHLKGNDGPPQQVRYPTMKGRQMAPGIWVSPNTIIHPAAQLAAPLCVDEHCWIDHDVELGPGTVIGAGSIVDYGATLYHSTVLEHTYVGQLVNLEHRIVQANTLIDPTSGDVSPVVDPFLLAAAMPTTTVANTFWRMITRVIALGTLVMVMPLLLFLTLLAFISTGRFVERQRRVGQRHASPTGSPASQQFTVYALPTRRASGNPTRIGAWMECYDFQRLPELINVVRGDMALVGVKPLSPDEASQLTEAWHQRRYDYAPGFTGLWYTRVVDTDLDSTLVNDVYYVATRNWRSDLHILVQTPSAWINRYTHRAAPHRTPVSQDYGRSSDALSSTRQEEPAA